MKENNKILGVVKVIAAASLASFIAACGGGGGGGGSGGGSGASTSTGSTSTPATTASSVATSVASPTYTADSMESAAFSQLNAYRLAMGVGELAQDTVLDTAASAHALYLVTNFANGSITAVTHDEVSTNADYYEASPLSRARKAGAPTTEWIGENAAMGLAKASATAYASDCIGNYLDTVYHLQGATAVQQTLGVGFQTNTAQGTYSCVLDFGETSGVAGTPVANGFYPAGGQQMATTAIAHSPIANETGVARAMASESPNPAPDVAAPGRPVLVRVNAANGDTLTVSSFTLTAADGTVVPARIIVPASATTGSTGATADVNNGLSPGVVVLLPLSPLAANTTYTASFSGARDGTPISTQPWTFTTGS